MKYEYIKETNTKFNHINLLQQLHDKQFISSQTLLTEMGLDYNKEVQAMRQELKENSTNNTTVITEEKTEKEIHLVPIFQKLVLKNITMKLLDIKARRFHIIEQQYENVFKSLFTAVKETDNKPKE